MRRYMLDTDSISYAMRGHGRVEERLRAVPPSSVCMSAVTLGQLHFGARLRKSKKLLAHVELAAAEISVVPFNRQAAIRFGQLAADLSDAGTRIGELDTMIAAHALSLGLTLVTNNTKHFSVVPGLTIENWT